MGFTQKRWSIGANSYIIGKTRCLNRMLNINKYPDSDNTAAVSWSRHRAGEIANEILDLQPYRNPIKPSKGDGGKGDICVCINWRSRAMMLSFI